MVTQNELMIVSGQLLAFTFNAILGTTMGDSSHVWRYMLAIAAVPAVLLFFGMLRVPESPRWLVSKGKSEHALGVLKKSDQKNAPNQNWLKLKQRSTGSRKLRKRPLKI